MPFEVYEQRLSLQFYFEPSVKSTFKMSKGDSSTKVFHSLPDTFMWLHNGTVSEVQETPTDGKSPESETENQKTKKTSPVTSFSH